MPKRKPKLWRDIQVMTKYVHKDVVAEHLNHHCITWAGNAALARLIWTVFPIRKSSHLGYNTSLVAYKTCFLFITMTAGEERRPQRPGAFPGP